VRPISKLKLDEHSFPLLKRTIANNVLAQRQRKTVQVKVPDVLGIKLTNRCNLRCEHCYQWNDAGYHHHMSKAEQVKDLDIGVFERLLEDTRQAKSRLYLWGGEPLVHRHIKRILELLEADPRETTICTNAHFIDKHIAQLCRVSPNLELLIAVEGFEAEHDGISGKGSFRKVMGEIENLGRLREIGAYQGKISVHTVINDNMVGRLYELMDLYERNGVDLVLLTFPWYISEATSREMDEYVKEQFDWLIDTHAGRHTWDAFKYRLSTTNINALMTDLGRINARLWRTKIRYQPELEFDEIEAFVAGRTMTARCANKCGVLNTRVDVGPTGKVTACKFFSEFNVGDLHKQSIAEIWQSEAYGRVREILGKQLSPACSKCNVLYLHAHSTPIHI